MIQITSITTCSTYTVSVIFAFADPYYSLVSMEVKKKQSAALGARHPVDLLAQIEIWQL